MRLFYLLVGVWLSWGLGYPLMAWTLQAVDLFSSRLIVMPLSGLGLLAVGVAFGRAPLLPQRTSWRWIALTAFFNMSLFQIFLISGVALLGPSRTPIIIYTMPAWSALFGALFLNERITARVGLALLFGLTAVGIIIVQEIEKVSAAPLGTILTLCGAIAFGIGTVLMRAISWHDDLSIIAGWQILIGTIPVIAVWWSFRDSWYFRPEETIGLAAMVASIIFCNVLAYFCWFRVIRALPASSAGLTTLVVPCVGFASSVILIGGTVSLSDLLALLLVLLSVSLVIIERAAAAKSVATTSRGRHS